MLESKILYPTRRAGCFHCGERISVIESTGEASRELQPSSTFKERYTLFLV